MREIDDVGGLEVYPESVELAGELFGDVVAAVGAGRRGREGGQRKCCREQHRSAKLSSWCHVKNALCAH
jgi:hypothetical protein